MKSTLPRRRLLLAASPETCDQMVALLDDSLFDVWDIMQAGGFSQARFLQQHDPCELILVHHDLLAREGRQGMSWLAWRRDVPLIFLADGSAQSWQLALQAGVSQCLPYELVLRQPELLAAALERAMNGVERDSELERNRLQLRQTRLHVDRLVHMLWRSAPAVAEGQWHSQRSLLERLQEELSRSERHQLPFTLALGEVRGDEDESLRLPDWTVDLVVRGKRRSDVVGQYGPSSFLLLLMHTPAPGGMTCCRRLQQVIEQDAARLAGPHRPLRAFFGLASIGSERTSAAALLRTAEENLEAAQDEAMEPRIVVA